jgi:hypothetical protein
MGKPWPSPASPTPRPGINVRRHQPPICSFGQQVPAMFVLRLVRWKQHTLSDRWRCETRHEALSRSIPGVTMAVCHLRSVFSCLSTIVPKLPPANRLNAPSMKKAARLAERPSEAFVGGRTRRGPCRGALRRHDCARSPALDLVGRIAGAATSCWLCVVPSRSPSQATDCPNRNRNQTGLSTAHHGEQNYRRQVRPLRAHQF